MDGTMAASSSRAVRKTSTTVTVPARAANRLDVHSSKGGTSPFHRIGAGRDEVGERCPTAGGGAN